MRDEHNVRCHCGRDHHHLGGGRSIRDRDAALYPIVLHDAWRWCGDQALIERHLSTAERCPKWIDEYGDRDGDGFQEYETRSPVGYENQSWKDASEAVVYLDGSLVKGP